MKNLAYASVAVLLLIYSYSSLSADPPNRPQGVEAKDWIQVSDRLGLVLAKAEPTGPMITSPQALLLSPPVGGYFMVKGSDGWARLIVIEPFKGPGGAG